MHEIKIEGISKVVRGESLFEETQRGWKVIGSYQDSVMESVFEQEPLPAGQQPYGGYTPTPGFVNVQKWKPALVTFFVLMKDAESVIAALNDQLKEACEKSATAHRECDAAQKSLKETETKLENAKNHNQAVDNALKDLRATREKELTTSRKLEVDIGKIRTAIGERQLKEILGA